MTGCPAGGAGWHNGNAGHHAFQAGPHCTAAPDSNGDPGGGRGRPHSGPLQVDPADHPVAAVWTILSGAREPQPLAPAEVGHDRRPLHAAPYGRAGPENRPAEPPRVDPGDGLPHYA
eukprot:2407106-Rhodomonas_salina.1